MRHSKGFNHLGRTPSHRKAMLANMATSLILHKRIATTTAKAKALRTFVEPIITKSKEDSTHNRRVAFSKLKDKNAVAELFREVSLKIAERQGGYTRILRTGNRLGDNADMCIIELVDYNEAMLGGDVVKTKTTRRRRTAKKKTEAISETKAAETVGNVEETSGESVVEAKAPESSVENETETTEEPVDKVKETPGESESGK